MLNEQFLNMLRCPLNPNEVALQQEEQGLLCPQCEVRFRIKDGFPILVKEEAIYPDGCESWTELPCQREKRN